MKRLGVIDIGSNSVRLVIGEITDVDTFKIIDDLKESIRLGEDLEDTNFISDTKIDKTINTLKTFKVLCDALKVNKILAIATEAVRKAENKEDLITKVKNETNIDIRILTGEEEANYDALAIMNSMYTHNSLIVDIGGSSTEIIWLLDNKIKEYVSLPFGSVNLTKRYDLQDLVSAEKEEALKRYVLSFFDSIPWLKEHNFDNIIAIGGAARNIGKIDRKRKRYPLDISHNYVFSDLDLQDVFHMVKSKNLKQRKKIEGLSKDRADIFVAPVSVLHFLCEKVNIKEIIVSGKGLREGIIYEYLNENLESMEDVLDLSLKGVLRSHNLNEDHAHNVYNTTSKLFNELKSVHNLQENYDKIIKTSAFLHDSGISIRYYDHHKHSFYIILNSEINGLSHRELVMSAYIAAFHRNNDFDVNLCQYSGVINKLDLINIRKIGVLLKISESLDRSMTGAIMDIHCIKTSEKVIIKISSSKNMDIEIADALKCAGKFKEIYDLDLEILKEE